MAKAKISQKKRFMKFMSNGRTLSTKQAKSMFRSKKPSARVRELREDGIHIISTVNKVGNFAYALMEGWNA